MKLQIIVGRELLIEKELKKNQKKMSLFLLKYAILIIFYLKFKTIFIITKFIAEFTVL